MVKKFRFRQFPVYTESLEYRRKIVLIIKYKFPSSERFLLSDQLYRALNSIVLNIAEGSGRNTDKDFSHFLTIAIGSVFETVACLDIAFTEKYISIEEFNSLIVEAESLANQLTAFKSVLLRKK